MAHTRRVKAITLTQPWATLMVARVLHGDEILKPVETRSFQVSVGERMLIHAGKGDAGQRASIVHPGYHRFREPYATALNRCGYSSRDPWWNKWPGDTETDARGTVLRMVPLASIVGAVTWWDCISTNEVPASEWQAANPLNFALGNYDPDRFAWRADAQQIVQEPIPCKGAQGFWYAPDDVVEIALLQGITL